MIGSYVRSQIGSGESKSSSGYTQCSDCRVRMKDVTIFNSSAVSQTLGEVYFSCRVFLFPFLVVRSMHWASVVVLAKTII